jgi:hypothetical protein
MLPIHHTHPQMDAIFSPVVAAAYSIIVQAMTCALSSLFLPHRFLARIDPIVLLFLLETSKEYLS